MTQRIPHKIFRRYLWAGIGILVILTVGTFGFQIIGGGKNPLIDCLYMTFITITTIGYGEIVDMTHNPWGRVFTMGLALSGIGVLSYIVMNATAFVVEGRINEAFRRKRMEKKIDKLRKHYIVCGGDGVGHYVIHELDSTKRSYVLIDPQRKMIDRTLEAYDDQAFVEGDPTDNDILLKAGIEHAQGIFAVTNDDNQNLVISLTAKQMNPHIRVITCCTDLKNSVKMQKAGADAVVSPSYIGGMRIVSEMVRPTVVSFLDLMLRQKDETLRVEEVEVPGSFAGKTLLMLDLKKYPHLLLLALRSEDRWIYNPPREQVMRTGDTLIFMADTNERHQLEQIFSSG